jgi:hypothetical protein
MDEPKKRGRPKKTDAPKPVTPGVKGRPVGVANGGVAKTKSLLNKLENEHKFHVIPELIRIYDMHKKVWEPIMIKMVENKTLTDKEEQRLDKLGKEMKEILFKFLGYCYPKLKATEIHGKDMDRVVFNIIDSTQVQAPVAPKAETKPKLIHFLNTS